MKRTGTLMVLAVAWKQRDCGEGCTVMKTIAAAWVINP